MSFCRLAGPRRLARQTGQIVFVALVSVLLVGAAASLVAGSLALESRHAVEEGRRVRLTALTDAAVAEALAHLAESERFPGRPETPLGGGTYESRTQSLGSGLVEILATARIGGRERRVRAVARVRPESTRVVRWERVTESQGSQR